MVEQKMRTLEVLDGKRTGIRLDEATWQAIDWLAERRGKKWAQWASEVIQRKPTADNMTAVVREAAMNELLSETIFAERANDLAAMDGNVYTRNHGVVDDDGLRSYQDLARGESDFGGFAILFGVDDEGRDFLAVRNGLRGGVHFVTVLERNES